MEGEGSLENKGNIDKSNGQVEDNARDLNAILTTHVMADI